MISATVRRLTPGLALSALLLPGCVDIDSDWEVPTAPLPPGWTWTADPECREPAAGARHEVRYWSDANAGGGRPGECDPRGVDHQGSVELPAVCNDKVIAPSHGDALTEDVCGTPVAAGRP